MNASSTVVKSNIEQDLTYEALLVRNALIERGLETPMIETGLDTNQKYQR